jgi:DNA replication protein DnaC
MLLFRQCKDYPCHDQAEPREFARAIDEGRHLEKWECDTRKYWKVVTRGNLPLRDDEEFDCPLWLNKQKELEELQRLQVKEEKKTFDNFDASVFKDPSIVDEIRRFHQTRYKYLLLLGGTGSGKTHLAKALLNSLEGKIKQMVFSISASRLYELFFDESHYDKAGEARAKLKYIYSFYFLFIDDLGDEKHNKNQLFNDGFKKILDEFKGRIIMTSNLNYEDMKTLYGEKICSRLQGRSLVKILDAPDYRKRHLQIEQGEA